MTSSGLPSADRFALLRQATTARIGLGRVGCAMPTAPVLAFQLAHARARDAVFETLAVDDLAQAVQRPTLQVKSAAANRELYLQNPALGRRMSPQSDRLQPGDYDLCLILADGLSAGAVNRQGPDLVRRLIERLPGWTIAPIVIAEQARVAIGDEIGHGLQARLAAVLIGERPGLSSPESLGAYITFNPRAGCRDSERNCVSNIHGAGGLSLHEAAEKIAWLLTAARRLGFTGTALKDRQDIDPLIASPPDPDHTPLVGDASGLEATGRRP